MITEEQIIEYLESRYANTKFRFFSLVTMLRHFDVPKEQLMPTLEKLRQKKILRRRAGLNAILVEYLRENVSRTDNEGKDYVGKVQGSVD